MKARIEVLLSIWGRWAIRRASGALGYPSVSPMFRDAPKGDGFGDAIPLGFAEPDILAVDAAVMRLPVRYRSIIIVAYQRRGSLRKMARDLGMRAEDVYPALSYAHSLIDGYLHGGFDGDETAGTGSSIRNVGSALGGNECLSIVRRA